MRVLSFSLTLLCLCSISAEAAPKVEALLQSSITGVVNHQTLMSRVTVPPSTSLPRHYHPTEEFLYVARGSITLKIDGESDLLLVAGSAHTIPAKTVHMGITGEEEAQLIVFRVHPDGQPVVIKPVE